MIEFGNGEIGCDHDAFRKRFNTSDWKPLTTATGDEGLRADMYSDPDAGPGHVRAIVAQATKIGDVWQMRLCATVVDNDGQAHTGTLGKHYKELTSAASAKMQATRNVHGFARGNRVEFEPDVHSGPWQPGDWVIDAALYGFAPQKRMRPRAWPGRNRQRRRDASARARPSLPFPRAAWMMRG